MREENSASPQCQNGFTKIANELFEAITQYGGLNERARVILAIIRLTYGYHKKTKKIPYKQIAKLTGMKRQNISRTVIKLKEYGIILENGHGEIGLQKDYTQWQKSSGLITKKSNQDRLQSVINIDNKELSGLITTTPVLKKTLKKTLKKPEDELCESSDVSLKGKDKQEAECQHIAKDPKSKAKQSESSTLDEKEYKPEHRELAELLAKTIMANPDNKKVKTPKNEATWLKWTDVIRLMAERDENTLDEIRMAIEWLPSAPQNGNFCWWRIIQSANGLRKHFSQIWSSMSGDSKSALAKQKKCESTDRIWKELE